MLRQVQFYNTLSKKVELFKPANPHDVRVYHCGPTVYKRQHIGNMRRFLFADFLHRSLELLGYSVTEVTNITDVGHLTQDDIDAGEDKLAREARQSKMTVQDIAQRETATFFADRETLNILPSSAYPRATDHIAEMQDLIRQLIEQGHAYVTSSGIYFDVTSFPSYGALSGNTIDSIAAGKRVKVLSDKRQPSDFALWIFDGMALQRWDSPWGVGYPGWHIECSAMSMKYLGETIDIHTGGEDNRFPHHENERAQSEGVTDKPFVRYWMHNRHLQFDGKKLAKREGEQITLDTLTEQGYSPLAFRLLVFGSHYRSPMDFSWELMDMATEQLEVIKNLLRRFHEGGYDARPTHVVDAKVLGAFSDALADDLNTPKALAVFMDYVHTLNAQLDQPVEDSADSTPTPPQIQERARAFATMLRLDQVLGLVDSLLRHVVNEAMVIPEQVRHLVEQRERARGAEHYDEADQLRQAVEKLGYYIEDTPGLPRIIPIDQK